MALNYISGCECGWCARTNYNRCAARHVWPTRLGIWGRSVFEIIHVDVEYPRICVYLYSYDPFHLIWSNPWGTQFVFLCWGVISEHPAPNWECALRPYCRNSFSAGVWLFVAARTSSCASYSACRTHDA